jgi:hypothetical protein
MPARLRQISPLALCAALAAAALLLPIPTGHAVAAGDSQGQHDGRVVIVKNGDDADSVDVDEHVGRDVSRAVHEAMHGLREACKNLDGVHVRVKTRPDDAQRFVVRVDKDGERHAYEVDTRRLRREIEQALDRVDIDQVERSMDQLGRDLGRMGDELGRSFQDHDAWLHRVDGNGDHGRHPTRGSWAARNWTPRPAPPAPVSPPAPPSLGGNRVQGDAALDAEIDRLQAEVQRLSAELQRLQAQQHEAVERRQ